MAVYSGCFTASGRYETCLQGIQQCCDGLGCVENKSGHCCGPNSLYTNTLRGYTEYCTSSQQCCSNTVSAICCDDNKHCCTDVDGMIYCCDSVTITNPYLISVNDYWWIWAMFIMIMLLFVAVVVVTCFNDSGRACRQTRRLSYWYHDRYSPSNERVNLSGNHQQDPSPPLYQTIVSPTYQYQKPPSPREPPPKYEENSESAPQHQDDSSGEPSREDTGSTEVSESLSNPTKSGKVKRTRLTPLLKHMRSLGAPKKSFVGHNIFDQNSESKNIVCNNSDVESQEDRIEHEESLVFEFRTETVNSCELVSH